MLRQGTIEHIEETVRETHSQNIREMLAKKEFDINYL